MLSGRRNTDRNFPGSHCRIYIFFTLGHFLAGFFLGLAGLGFLEPVGRGWGEQDQDHDNGAQDSDQDDAQIADMGAENLAFCFGLAAGWSLHQRILSRGGAESEDPVRLTPRKA